MDKHYMWPSGVLKSLLLEVELVASVTVIQAPSLPHPHGHNLAMNLIKKFLYTLIIYYLSCSIRTFFYCARSAIRMRTH